MEILHVLNHNFFIKDITEKNKNDSDLQAVNRTGKISFFTIMCKMKTREASWSQSGSGDIS